MPEPGGGRASLALESGELFHGRLFGGSPRGGLGVSDSSPPLVGGEVVFHTGMTGYQEIVTDPSYAGQIVVFTAPHIGNYGIHAGEDESARVHPAAIIVRDHCVRSFHQRADRSLEDMLRRAHVPALSEVDTRALTVVLREGGARRGVIGMGSTDALVKAAQAWPSMQETDWVSRVTCERPWDMPSPDRGPDRPYRVAVFDFGVKQSILERLRDEGCALRVFPAHTPVDAIVGAGFEGVFLSNGPGDPALLDGPVDTIRRLLDADVPIFGICLGHQLLARALGAATYKLPFGHHGANHPVRRESDRRVEITSHNHNYAVRADSLEGCGARLTHRSLNDDCVEGMDLPGRPVYSVQYHPEAAPGPRDGQYLFDRFMQDMAARRENGQHAEGKG